MLFLVSPLTKYLCVCVYVGVGVCVCVRARTSSVCLRTPHTLVCVPKDTVKMAGLLVILVSAIGGLSVLLVAEAHGLGR